MAEWNHDYFAAFDFASIYEEIKEKSPNLVGLLDTLSSGTYDGVSSQQKRKIVTVLAELAQLRNPHTNFLQGMISVYLFASKVPKRVMSVLNHIGITVSYSTLLRTLQASADAARTRLREIAGRGEAFIPVFDNLTKLASISNHRTFNTSGFLNLTTGFIYVPAASHASPMFTRAIDIRREYIDKLCFEHFFPTKTDHSNVREGFSSLIADVLKGFAQHKDIKVSNLGFLMRPVFQIDPKAKPELLPLPTYDLNEQHTQEMVQILYNIEDDSGMSVEQCIERLVMVVGDQATVEKIT
jgi:hypothetical protein